MQLPKKLVVIGASTGGPGQIEKIIKSLPVLRDTVVLIAQHMSMDFIPSFTKRLKELSVNTIGMAQDGTFIESGNIYLCHGMTSVKKDGYGLKFQVELSQQYKYNPDINTVFNSLVPFAQSIEILGVILTGIGDDGVDGCKQLSLSGVRTVTQDEKSAIVDGMPSRARKEIQNIEIADTQTIQEKIRSFCS
ncbi:MAG: CheB methylesterase domain-containing protein [Sulfurimonas sp.]|uniref:chemotaxis protein CheB n=1 Tax=Sulfurimonas sp. TaxID=2022749 RepID=UPI0028CF70F0|nr:CheB methylesterase domain-containing protein [Sulfurimonas sp.]MDT8339686.1 CheB methylesterase domain-containing protein [Sulfurimonas sp.]